MTKKFEVYKCDICGNIIEVLFEGAGELVCCEQPMDLLEEKTKEEGSEKHLPVFEKINENELLIKVGSEPHPMEEKHHIQMIEAFTEDRILRKYLDIHEKPEFLVKLDKEVTHAREYCNIHGLWKGENNDK